MVCHARSGTLGAIGGLCPCDCLSMLFMIASFQVYLSGVSFEELFYGSSIPNCARTSSRQSGEKSEVIALIVPWVIKNFICLFGSAIFIPVTGMTGSVGRIKSPVCVPVTLVTKSTLQLCSARLSSCKTWPLNDQFGKAVVSASIKASN